MQYLADLANKLAATYDTPTDVSADESAVEKRKQLVAALRRALELEATPENLEAQSMNPFSEYKAIGDLFAAKKRL